MSRPVSPEAQPWIPASWRIPIPRRPVVAVPLALIATLLLSDTGYAQTTPRKVLSRNTPIDPFDYANSSLVEGREPETQVVASTEVGVTRGREIASLPFDFRDDLGTGTERFGWITSIGRRPNTVVAGKGDERALFKRLVLAGRGIALSLEEASAKWGPVQGILTDTATEKFYQARGVPKVDILVRSQLPEGSAGLGLAVHRGTREVLEMYAFMSTSVAKLEERWGKEMDYTTPAPTSPVAPSKPATCEFKQGFKAIHDQIPQIVGECLEDEHHNPANGDALQRTTRGLAVWRKADNFTAFTDGHRSWVNGPYGLQERLNTEKLAWEKS